MNAGQKATARACAGRFLLCADPLACHSERSEESLVARRILRCAQNDRREGRRKAKTYLRKACPCPGVAAS